MSVAGSPIEAVLTLNASSFHTELNESLTAVKNFEKSLSAFSKNMKYLTGNMDALGGALSEAKTHMDQFNVSMSKLKQFETFATSVNKLANALKILSKEELNAGESMNIVNNMFKYFRDALNGTEVKIKGVVSSMQALNNTERQAIQVTEQYKLGATNVQQAITSMSNSTSQGRQNLALYHQNLRQLALGVEQFNAIETNHAMKEKEVATATNQASASLQKQASAMSQATAKTNQLSTATSRLGKAMSSLKMIGNLVGSMLAYNFAHKLLVATGETIHAKSEMEGYFKMLHFGQSDIDGFNQALDRTVAQFQRVNKYSLGETISSIGVEFNLTTQEMEKAMKVTSMITSEYLRAGRNANEASLAVKDVLQGQFQRLSRETGVKGEQLKEAGWSGDTTDVIGLMEALEKVGKSRNWDVFAEKANSLNDILTISQNRFGEWSADLVNVVQPAILNFFNSFMSFAQGMAEGLSSFWQWFNGDGWGQVALKIGVVTTALLTISQAFTMYRTNMSMVEIANLGFSKTLASVVLGLKGQQVAEAGVVKSIMARILGVKAETLAEKGVARAIEEKLLMTKLESAEEQINTAISTENSAVKKALALQERILKAEKEGLIAVEEADNLRKEINIALTESQSVASLKQVGVNGGLTASFIALGGAENITAVATGEVSVAMGVLNGVFALSPIGWFIAAVLALAGAFYVLSGGLSDTWDKMKTFHDTLENKESIIKSYKRELEETKEKYGETSEEAKNAQETLDNITHSIEHGTYWNDKYNESFEGIGAKLDNLSRRTLEHRGWSKEQIDKTSTIIDSMNLGANKYSRAIDVMFKQYADAEKGTDELAKKLEKAGISGDEASEAIARYNGNMGKLIEHSAIANTTDDWWEWMWNSLYAGMDQFWINWDNFWGSGNIFSAVDTAFQSFMNYDSIGKSISNLLQLDKLGSAFDWLKGLNLDKMIEDFKNTFKDFDIWKIISDAFGGGSATGMGTHLMKNFNISDAIKGLFDGVDVSWIGEWVNNTLIAPITTAWNEFIADPLSFIGESLGISGLINALISGGSDDPNDIDPVKTFIHNSIITPITTAWNEFIADPLGFIGGLIQSTGIGGLIDALIPPDGGASIWTYVQNNIITPFSNAISNGIASIPILGDIASLLGLVPQQNPNAQDKGSQLGRAFGNAITTAIGQIPIIGDIARMLGLIPQENGDAHDKGHGVGENIKKGEQEGHQGMADNVKNEMTNVINAISNKASEAYAVAHDIGSKILNGIKNALDMHSPSVISRELIANEFGIYIPQAISDSSEVAYSNAVSYGQSIKDGISSVSLNSFGTFTSDYESDAQTISATTDMMSMNTTTAFTNMSTAVNGTTTQMQSNVVGTYSTIATKQGSMLNDMKQKNTTAYNDMYTKSNQALIQMRDSTSNITHQMTNAWNSMKNSIVQSAQQLQHDSTVHFNTLSNTIGNFYRKIQNPSSWGSAGSPHGVSHAPRPRTGRAIAKGFSGGGNRWTGSNTMTIASLKKKICPTGDCSIFDGWNATDIVNVSEFLSMFADTGHAFGGWSYHNGHYNYIKNTSDNWSMKSPTIQLKGGIPTNADYYVRDFEGGAPKISFGSFQSMAESIFSAIPYKFYYDSSWKGSWLGALQAGACNCWDGAHALIAFAQSCGFNGSIVHGTWVDPDGSTYPHVWANINGKKMDTTAWQQRGSWSAGSPNVRTSNPVKPSNSTEKVINVTIDMSNSTVYGVDDLDSKIKEGVKEGLREEFNDPYTIKI